MPSKDPKKKKSSKKSRSRSRSKSGGDNGTIKGPVNRISGMARPTGGGETTPASPPPLAAIVANRQTQQAKEEGVDAYQLEKEDHAALLKLENQRIQLRIQHSMLRENFYKQERELIQKIIQADAQVMEAGDQACRKLPNVNLDEGNWSLDISSGLLINLDSTQEE